MGVPAGAPQAVHDYWNSIPQDNCGDLYAKLKPPFLPEWLAGFWIKVEVWGQVCDGRPHEDAVRYHLYNHFSNHGKGFTHVALARVPDNPELNKYPREGRVENPLPFSGKLR